jgi:hypothetical protein
MKSSDHLGMYLEACMTSVEGREAILTDAGVRRELENLPIKGKALMSALIAAAKKLEAGSGYVIPYLQMQVEQQNFLNYFDGWVTTR